MAVTQEIFEKLEILTDAAKYDETLLTFTRYRQP